MQASERRLARRRSELGRYAGSASLRSAALSTAANAVASVHDSHNHPSLRQVLATLICCKHTLEELMLDLTCSAVACSWTHSLNDDLSEFEHELSSLSKLRELSIRSPKGYIPPGARRLLRAGLGRNEALHKLNLFWTHPGPLEANTQSLRETLSACPHLATLRVLSAEQDPEQDAEHQSASPYPDEVQHGTSSFGDLQDGHSMWDQRHADRRTSRVIDLAQGVAPDSPEAELNASAVSAAVLSDIDNTALDVRPLMRRPSISPRESQTSQDAAWAIGRSVSQNSLGLTLDGSWELPDAGQTEDSMRTTIDEDITVQWSAPEATDRPDESLPAAFVSRQAPHPVLRRRRMSVRSCRSTSSSHASSQGPEAFGMAKRRSREPSFSSDPVFEAHVNAVACRAARSIGRQRSLEISSHILRSRPVDVRGRSYGLSRSDPSLRGRCRACSASTDHEWDALVGTLLLESAPAPPAVP
ncbi:hypothetical protein CBOM_03250 [Ceraceosorus bombacis]|uniref:Uncharacterized protein n=1 Tax=Ceraceosorus bombacis TaxID=401625 RepID=A0A0P1BNG8_9BASI|nr:hypothetical protein CBOM_03250 [Ceraceosorus bombacis]